ncbi:MAG: hypothetical protein ACR2PR_00705 [Pseudohongiellaceae bacterium]
MKALNILFLLTIIGFSNAAAGTQDTATGNAATSTQDAIAGDVTAGAGDVAADDSAATVTDATELMRERALYEEQLTALESRYGPYHNSLLEPLEKLVELARASSDFEQAGKLLNQRLQVTRTELGFQHPDIIPLLRQLAEIEFHRGDWEAVADQLGHIRTLVAANSGAPSAALLEAINEQLHWRLTQILLDDDKRRSRHFMAARELSDDILDMAEDLYGEDDPEMIPWLYESALNNYRLVELLNAGGGLGSDTIERVVREEGVSRLNSYGRSALSSGIGFGSSHSRIPVVEKGDMIGEFYLRDGLSAIKDIVKIAEQQGDVEMQAMALIYQGDYQLLMGRGALSNYREASELLQNNAQDSAEDSEQDSAQDSVQDNAQDSSITEADIAHFFSRPVLIPLATFYARFADALVAQEAMWQSVSQQSQHKPQQQDVQETGTGQALVSSAAQETGAGLSSAVVQETESTLYLGTFTAWENDLSATALPPVLQAGVAESLQFSRVELSLTVSQRGGVSSVKVLESDPDESRAASKARRAARALDFRPALNDRWRGERMVNARLSYRYPPD